jgi:hypothetical protein
MEQPVSPPEAQMASMVRFVLLTMESYAIIVIHENLTVTKWMLNVWSQITTKPTVERAVSQIQMIVQMGISAIHYV